MSQNVITTMTANKSSFVDEEQQMFFKFTIVSDSDTNKNRSMLARVYMLITYRRTLVFTYKMYIRADTSNISGFIFLTSIFFLL